MSVRYGIAEWYGEPLVGMPPKKRTELAEIALRESSLPKPLCPFRSPAARCNKAGGMCSMRAYDDETGKPVGAPVAMCPRRFEQGNLIPQWLAEVVGFESVYLAREVPFMRSPDTNKAAGRIDLVVAGDGNASDWYGLEIQAVYFSGDRMADEYRALRGANETTPLPVGKRRPDWRSSSAKRLMPQLEVKAPTLRRWGKKIAVAVDLPFFEAIGGQSESPSHDLNEGDVVWLVPVISEEYKLVRAHWEVLTLDASSKRLLSAVTIKREDFETELRGRLRRVGGEP